MTSRERVLTVLNHEKPDRRKYPGDGGRGGGIRTLSSTARLTGSPKRPALQKVPGA